MGQAESRVGRAHRYAVVETPCYSKRYSHSLVGGYGPGYGYIHGPSPVPPIYLAGSFGLVRPAWIYYTRSAVPQDVEGRAHPTAPPDASPRLSARAAYPVGGAFYHNNTMPRPLSSGGPLACVGEGAAATAHSFSGEHLFVLPVNLPVPSLGARPPLSFLLLCVASLLPSACTSACSCVRGLVAAVCVLVPLCRLCLFIILNIQTTRGHTRYIRVARGRSPRCAAFTDKSDPGAPPYGSVLSNT